METWKNVHKEARGSRLEEDWLRFKILKREIKREICHAELAQLHRLPDIPLVAEKIALGQFNNYLTRNNRLAQHESGNRKFHLTETLGLAVNSNSDQSEIVHSDELDLVVDSSDSNESKVDDDSPDPLPSTDETLRSKLATRATKNRCQRDAVNQLLQILNTHGHSLPKDSRTLCKTPRHIPTQLKCGGQYIYFGIEAGVVHILSSNCSAAAKLTAVDLICNVDGLPLFKSTNQQFSPILGHFNNFEVFVIALFYGNTKPDSVEEYLKDFIEEVNKQNDAGINHDGTNYKFSVKCFCCDAPARCLLKCVIGHTGYFACERCTVEGTWNGRVVFNLDNNDDLRTDELFSSCSYERHQKGPSPLLLCGVSCIQQFSLDYMHMVCLGVTKRILHYLKKGPRICKLSSQQFAQISDNLKALQGAMPSEFARQPRSLDELENSDDSKRTSYIEFAQDLLHYFVANAKNVYGETFTIYNVHGLKHLSNDVRYFKCSLNEISYFPFENYMQQLKKCVRNGQNPIIQVAKRLGEVRESRAKQPVAANFSKVGTVSDNFKDCCFLLEGNRYAFVREKRSNGTLVCDVLSNRQVENFYSSPEELKAFNVGYVRDIRHKAKRLLIEAPALHRKADTMTWTRAVWQEDDVQEEGVVPHAWIEDKTIKVTSGDKSVCEEYKFTTSAEASGDENIQPTNHAVQQRSSSNKNCSPGFPPPPRFHPSHTLENARNAIDRLSRSIASPNSPPLSTPKRSQSLLPDDVCETHSQKRRRSQPDARHIPSPESSQRIQKDSTQKDDARSKELSLSLFPMSEARKFMIFY
ncbi:Hypothetical predicted protein [Paramuricea clavata]|uniref:Uncharacterized protein n=1 Tax=Paramuricea clavata TaxID=317549 RepID=A0A7D9H8Q3_PARCT|nr:Hypothetical predicted protein [Paramuricea clavata]